MFGFILFFTALAFMGLIKEVGFKKAQEAMRSDVGLFSGGAFLFYSILLVFCFTFIGVEILRIFIPIEEMKNNIWNGLWGVPILALSFYAGFSVAHYFIFGESMDASQKRRDDHDERL